MHFNHCKGNHCIEKTLREIDQLQNNHHECHKGNKKDNNRCRSSCCQAIEELLNRKPPNFEKKTLPFILYLKNGCPFQVDGVLTYHCKCCDKERFKSFRTFLFRLCHFKYDCAVLELLTFKENHHEEHCCQNENPCYQIDGQLVDDLIRTGIFIKVDPSFFSAISLLKPMDIPTKGNHFHHKKC